MCHRQERNERCRANAGVVVLADLYNIIGTHLVGRETVGVFSLLFSLKPGGVNQGTRSGGRGTHMVHCTEMVVCVVSIERSESIEKLKVK